MIKKIIIIIFSLTLFFYKTIDIYAQNNLKQEKTYEAIIKKIIEEKEIEIAGEKNLYQKIELEILNKKSNLNKKINIEINFPPSIKQKYKVNDKVLITLIEQPNGKVNYFIKDYLRKDSLFILFLIFFVLTLIITRFKGLLSFIGMFFSFIIIFNLILPKIYTGEDPLKTTILGIIIIIPVTFFLSHGINKKTLSAILGTILSLIITGFLASFFIETTKLTGFASEEAGFLQIIKEGLINIKGLLLAGIIISALGILDDVNISQASIVFKLKETNKDLKTKDLYQKSMDIGQDHISSTINTLVLVYTGSSLPLLLLFVYSSKSFSEVINYEIIADEIVKTLITSIGLIISVPITTFIASIIASKEKN